MNVTSTRLSRRRSNASLEGKAILIDVATDLVRGASAAATLTNSDDKILGAGQLGDGLMKLVNSVDGIIDGDDAAALVINTGVNAIVNAGTIENTSTGGTTITSAVTNTGTLAVTVGTLTVAGAVSGAGKVSVTGGTADLAGAFTENVTLARGPPGLSNLAMRRPTPGTITWRWPRRVRTRSILPTSPSPPLRPRPATRGTTTGGMLTAVTDGRPTPPTSSWRGIDVGSTFKVSTDGHGGTKIVDFDLSASQVICGDRELCPPSDFSASGAQSAALERMYPMMMARV